MRKIKLVLILLGILVCRVALADMSWEEIAQDGKNTYQRKYYLKYDLLRIDLAKPAKTYYYNLSTHVLIVLNREDNQFYFEEWKNLTAQIAKRNSQKEKILGGHGAKVAGAEINFNTDPFGAEPLFYCPGQMFEASGAGEEKLILNCPGGPQAEVRNDKNADLSPEWNTLLDALRWIDLDRYKFFAALPALPSMILGKKPSGIRYEIKEVSKSPIPLSKFLLPEDASPVPPPD